MKKRLAIVTLVMAATGVAAILFSDFMPTNFSYLSAAQAGSTPYIGKAMKSTKGAPMKKHKMHQ